MKVVRNEDIEDKFDQYNSCRLALTYQFPAQPKLAAFHQRASKYGYDPNKFEDHEKDSKKNNKPNDKKDNEKLKDNLNKQKDKQEQEPKLCACCGLPTNTQRYDWIKQNTTPSESDFKDPKDYGPSSKQTFKQTFKLNSSGSMFFTFIKISIIFLLMKFIITDVFNIYSSIQAHYCKESTQECAMFYQFSGYNKKSIDDEQNVMFVDILNLLMVIASIIFFTYVKHMLASISDKVDRANHTQDDYTVFVQKLEIYLPTEDDSYDQSVNFYQIIRNLFVTELQNKQKQKDKWNDHFQKFEDLSIRDSMINQLEKGDFKNSVKSVSLCFDLYDMQKLNAIRQKLLSKTIQNQKLNKIISQQKTVFKKMDVIKNKKKAIKDRKKKQNREIQTPEEDKQLKDIKVQAKSLQDQNDKLQKQCSSLQLQLKQNLEQISLNDNYIQLSKQFANNRTSSFLLSHFIGKAFVSFQNQYIRDYFIKRTEIDPVKVNDRPLRIRKAVEPGDVYWYNLKISNYERSKSIIFSVIMLATILIISFFIILFCTLEQQNLNQAKENKDTLKTSKISGILLPILLTTIINGINFGIDFATDWLTTKQAHKTRTDFTISLMVKTIIAQFLNTAIIYFAVFVVKESVNPLSQNGLYVKIMYLVGVSGFIQIVTNFLPVMHSARYWYKKLKFDECKAPVYQITLNKLFQNTEFAFYGRYSYYILNVYVVCFYSYLCPATSLILALIFTVQYWVDKYNLCKRFACPADFSESLLFLTFKGLQISILIFAAGNLYFSYKIHESIASTSHLINFSALIIASLYTVFIIVMPIQKQTAELKKFSQQTTYQQCIQERYFKKVYWRCNPATEFALQMDIQSDNPSDYLDYGENKDRIAQLKDFKHQ